MSVAAALPQWLGGSGQGRRQWAVIAGAMLAVAGALYFLFAAKAAPTNSPLGLQMFQVALMDLEIKVAKDGEVHAINNIDINCQVEGTSTITTVVKEGTSVKKGDVLLTLDSTEIRQKMEDTSLELQKAEADLTNAREMFEIQKNTNDTNLESAQVSLELANLDLKQYVEGSYPQQLATAKTAVEMAKITLNNRLEDLEQTKKLYLKNFVTAADVKKSELDVTNARNSLAEAETALKVLTEYTNQMNLAQKKNSVLQTEQRLNRVRRENNSNLTWRTADMTAKERSLNVLKRRYDRLKEQYEACTVKAPADGMVVYGSTTDRNAQTPIQEGTQVRERQLLIRLPDTSAMKAAVRIHEALISKLALGMPATVKIVGQPEPVTAKISKISVLADNSQRWWNPDLREYPVDLALDVTPTNLKPGIGATVEIAVESLRSVPAIPLDAVYTVGNERYVFVREGDQILPRKIEVGKNNDAYVEVSGGLLLGQYVLRLQAGQGRELLEKSGINVQPTSRPGDAAGRGRRSEGGHAAASR